jgi:hypothetical protein
MTRPATIDIHKSDGRIVLMEIVSDHFRCSRILGAGQIHDHPQQQHNIVAHFRLCLCMGIIGERGGGKSRARTNDIESGVFESAAILISLAHATQVERAVVTASWDCSVVFALSRAERARTN